MMPIPDDISSTIDISDAIIETKEKTNNDLDIIRHLPEEVAMKIFSTLNKRDVFVSRTVNITWKQLIDNRHLASCLFYSDRYPLVDSPDVQKAIDQYYSSTRKFLKAFSYKAKELIKKLDKILKKRFFYAELALTINNVFAEAKHYSFENIISPP